MSLRDLGEWREEDWQYPDGRVSPQAVATKKFSWSGPAVAAANGEALSLGYYTTVDLPVAAMEKLEVVAARERDALALLERLVQLATEGVAYIPTPNAMRRCYAYVRGLIASWVEAGGYPDDWDVALQRAFAQSHAEASAELRFARGVQAVPETDPVLATFGLRIAIVPLTQPVVVP
jgi:hypothetical protein